MVFNELVRPADYWIVPISAAGVLLLAYRKRSLAGWILVIPTSLLIWRHYGTWRFVVHLILTAVIILSIRHHFCHPKNTLD